MIFVKFLGALLILFSPTCMCFAFTIFVIIIMESEEFLARLVNVNDIAELLYSCSVQITLCVGTGKIFLICKILLNI